MSTDREMTLNEYLERLPDIHLARRQYAKQMGALRAAEAREKRLRESLTHVDTTIAEWFDDYDRGHLELDEVMNRCLKLASYCYQAALSESEDTHE